MKEIQINDKTIGKNKPVYIIAEMSANHNQDFEKAVNIIKTAKACGADAIKLQTYTPDTLTINSSNEYFMLKDTIWKGKTLYELYSGAYTPWEWTGRLKKIAREIGIDFFSTPFDASAVDFLENLDMPAYKIASFEIIDIPLLKKVARTGKPVILSTGMASFEEIDEAVTVLKQAGCKQLCLLKCTSAYPASPEDANLRTIPHLYKSFHCPVGISDHTLGDTVPLGSVPLGASIIEKHFTLSREEKGADREFSMEPAEFKTMVTRVRELEKALGRVSYDITGQQKQSLVFRRSLFIVENIAAGEPFTEKNVRSIRPSHGMHTRNLPEVLGKKARHAISKGTPLSKNMVIY